MHRFIQRYRADFDAAQPDPNLWDAVEKALHRRQDADALERFLLDHRFLLDAAEPPVTAWNRLAAQLEATAKYPLEDFIRQNREMLDAAMPPETGWNQLAERLPAEKAEKIAGGSTSPMRALHWSRHLLRAAAAVTLLLMGVGLGIWYAETTDNRVAQDLSLGELSPEYAELERYYQNDIAGKKEKLAEFAAYRDPELLADLQQMDKIMEELQRELAYVPPANREKVVRAMIENYQAKAAILQRVLEYLQQSSTSRSKNYNYEPQHI
ncbi:MAG: hypothetical protein ACR2K1_00995 [Saprospiraceae bacterium]